MSAWAAPAQYQLTPASGPPSAPSSRARPSSERNGGGRAFPPSPDRPAPSAHALPSNLLSIVGAPRPAGPQPRDGLRLRTAFVASPGQRPGGWLSYRFARRGVKTPDTSMGGATDTSPSRRDRCP